jgi:hypothetical protein
MSGYKSRRQIPARTPDAVAISQLDQLAAAVADARAQPQLAALAQLEEQFIASFNSSPFGATLDPVTVGATMMILGNMFASHVNTMPEEQRGGAGILVNLARLAGQRIYTGDRLPVTHKCPYAYSSGALCGKEYTGTTQEQADLLMNGHVQLHHPGKAWPPVEEPAEVDEVDDDPGALDLDADAEVED